MNLNIEYWMREACRFAKDYDAMITFQCDNADQARQAAEQATKWLHGYKRIALERMYEGTTRVHTSDLS